MALALLGLGANLGDRAENISLALDALDNIPMCRVKRRSSFYETEPFGVPDEQPDYLNCAAEVETELSPEALLGACLGVEAALGRLRPYDKAPRVIDIDLLLYENAERSSAELSLPHPRMTERAFVLVPLSDLYPDMNIYGNDYSKHLGSVCKSGVKKLDI